MFFTISRTTNNKKFNLHTHCCTKPLEIPNFHVSHYTYKIAHYT